MSNLMHAALLRRGLGFNIPQGGIFGGGDVFGGGVYGDGGGIDWNNVFGQSVATLNNFLTLKYSKDAAKYGVGVTGQPAVNYTTQGASPYGAAPPAGVGIGVDGQGIRLSDGSHIGWAPIMLGVGALVLLQSKGFSRR